MLSILSVIGITNNTPNVAVLLGNGSVKQQLQFHCGAGDMNELLYVNIST
jgi:hypothetical protein